MTLGPALAQSLAANGGAEAMLGWIVLIAIGLMVVGVLVTNARRFTAGGRQRAKVEGAAGRAGRWLIFLSILVLGIGIASYIAQREQPVVAGGETLAALGLIGVGIALFIAGSWAVTVARRRSNLYRNGVDGEALIRDMRRSRTDIYRHSVYEFDLSVSSSTFPPIDVTHRDLIPMSVSGGVEKGATVPVKIDPSNPRRVVFDWDRFDAAPAADGRA